MGPARAGSSAGVAEGGTSLGVSVPHGEALPKGFPAGGDVVAVRAALPCLSLGRTWAWWWL